MSRTSGWVWSKCLLILNEVTVLMEVTRMMDYSVGDARESTNLTHPNCEDTTRSFEGSRRKTLTLGSATFMEMSGCRVWL